MGHFNGRIRAARQDDVDAISAIYNEAVADRVATCDLSDVTPETRREWLSSMRRPYGVWVAEHADLVQGWVMLAPYDTKPCFRRTATFATYVRRTARGCGVGSALRAHMISTAQRSGLHVLVNRVWANNEASIALAKRFGFRQVGYLPELVELDGAFIDCLFFELILDETPAA